MIYSCMHYAISLINLYVVLRSYLSCFILVYSCGPDISIEVLLCAVRIA